MKLAAIADVHGNTWALRTVLDDIRKRGIQTIVNLGDSFYGSLEPAGTAELLVTPKILSISGNQDRIIGDPPAGVEETLDHRYVLSQLRREHLDWLRSLPSTFSFGDDVFLCHGTPSSDEAYFLETVTPHGARLADPDEIAARLGPETASLILCGHSHVPRVVQVPGGRLVVNPGSVGLPAYDDDLPYPHKMEAGSPHARYAIVARSQSGWTVDLIALNYDWHTAADYARRNGRPDRARWIETGRA
jgi:predicted phosphodiesterase